MNKNPVQPSKIMIWIFFNLFGVAITVEAYEKTFFVINVTNKTNTTTVFLFDQQFPSYKFYDCFDNSIQLLNNLAHHFLFGNAGTRKAQNQCPPHDNVVSFYSTFDGSHRVVIQKWKQWLNVCNFELTRLFWDSMTPLGASLGLAGLKIWLLECMYTRLQVSDTILGI